MSMRVFEIKKIMTKVFSDHYVKKDNETSDSRSQYKHLQIIRKIFNFTRIVIKETITLKFNWKDSPYNKRNHNIIPVSDDDSVLKP